MRHSVLTSMALLSLLSLALLAPPADAWYPKTPQVEIATATWCSSCPIAYAGVEASKASFDANEFNAIRYYSSESGGQMSCPASMARLSYYGITSASGYPELHFDGTVNTHRVTSLTAAGRPYEALIDAQLDDPTWFRIVVNAFDFSAPTGEIDLDIQVKENIADISNLKLRMVIVEDNLSYGGETLHDVTRASLADVALTVDAIGEVQTVNPTFTVDPAWIEENLTLVAFIQDDATKTVLTSASTRIPPDFSFRFYALGDKVEIAPPNDEFYYEWFRTYNTGTTAQMFTFSVTTEGPADWYSSICGAGICYGPVYSVLLQPNQFAELKVEAIAPSSGAGIFTLNITTDLYPDPAGRTFKYTYVTDDVHVLVVDDDGLEDYEHYYTDALDYYDVQYAMIDAVYTKPTAELLGNFDVVIWVQGTQYPTLDGDDRTAVSTYLSGGGNLFLSGQDLGWELSHINQWSWLQNSMHAFFFNDVGPDLTLEAVSGDPIADGLPLTIQGGDGANNQDSPSEIYPADGMATGLWSYAPDQWAAIRVDSGTYKLVYFAFGFEAIDNARDRNVVMHRILNWFFDIGAVDDEPQFRQALSVFPNPVRDHAAVRFTLPGAERATVNLFGLDGRLVRTLATGELAAGSHVIDLDRADGQGAALPAGLYYCRVEGERTQLVQKVVVVQ